MRTSCVASSSGSLLAVGDRAVGDLRDVLMKGAAARDVERLRPAADAEDRQAAGVRLPRELHFEGIELGLGRPQLGVRGAAVGGRVEVGPAREQHAAETVEQGAIRSSSSGGSTTGSPPARSTARR